MRRFLPWLAITLGIGVVVNVAVAWWCAARWDPFAPTAVQSGSSLINSGASTWHVETGAWRGVTYVYSMHISGAKQEHSLSVDEMIPIWAGPMPPVDHECVDVAFGWPFRSMIMRDRDFEPSRSVSPWIVHKPQWLAVLSRNSDIALPREIIWAGFTADSVLYAAAAWILFAAPSAIRRRKRLRRGLCPHCAYPIGSSDVCTECGKAVGPTRARTPIH